MVRSRYAADITKETRQRILSEGYDKVRADERVKVYSLVSANQDDDAKGKDAVLHFEVDVLPEFTTPKWRTIKVEAKMDPVTDADVQTQIDQIRAQRATFEKTESAAAKADYVRLSYSGTINGKPLTETAPEAGLLGQAESTWEEAGAESDLALIPSIAKALVGLKAGDARTVEHTFPADHTQETLRGKQASYAVTVTEVRTRKLPELDDAFIQSVGAKDKADMLDQVRKGLEGQRRQQSEGKRREEALDLLLKGVEFPLPESAVERETYDLFMEYANLRVRGGATPESLEKDRDQIMADSRKAAATRVRTQIVLAQIAREEKLTVTQEELGQAVVRAAYSTRTAPEKIAKDRDQLILIQRDTLLNKALDLILAGGTLPAQTAEKQG
jgi:trigger factor